MTQNLVWTTVQRTVNELMPLSINPRKISEAKRMKMIESIQRFNLVDIPVVDLDNTVVSGHQRLRAMQAIGRGEELIDVRMPNRKLTERELKDYNVLANSHFGEFDADLFEEFFSDVDLDGLGFASADFGLKEIDSLVSDAPKIEDKAIRYFEMTHILFSFPPQSLSLIEGWVQNIKNTSGVEYEQSSN